MKRKRHATKNSWTIAKTLPENRVTLPYQAVYSAAEFDKIARGLIPKELEDPWFMYVENNILAIHANDGRGACLYQVTFEQVEDNFQVVKSWASRDPDEDLPHLDRQLVWFAQAYNEVPKLEQLDWENMSEADTISADLHLLKYLIDHWLIQQPWRGKR